jgi:hypothetical protein
MKKTRSIFAAEVLLALSVCFVAGCGDNSTGSSSQKKSTLTVTVRENPGTGLEGFEILVTPGDLAAVTDSTGTAFFADIPLGQYQVTAKKSGYLEISKAANIGADPWTYQFTYLPSMKVTASIESWGPLANADLESNPAGLSGRTDDNGVIVFERVPEQSYTFTVRREGKPDLVFEGIESSEEVQISTKASPPSITISAPESGAALPSGMSLRFIGKGTDIVDGDLPDSTLVWSSDVDGILGKGRDLMVNALSVGVHTISLRGINSGGKEGTNSISIEIQDFQLDSYFPFTVGETWYYTYISPEFYTTGEDGSAEYWSIKSLNVRTREPNIREVKLLYDVVRKKNTIHCSYVIKDSYQEKDGEVGIIQSAEDYTETDNSGINRQITVSTTYSPSYPAIGRSSNMTPGAARTSNITTWVIWSYIDNGISSIPYLEQETIPVTITAGDATEIPTDRGTFNAVQVTIRENLIEKRWWLAKGIGLVQFEDNSFSPKATAVLRDASLLRFMESGSPSAKPALGSLMSPSTPTFPIDRRTPQGKRALLRLLSSMCPR